MKRREFVKLGSRLAGALASRQLRSAPPVRAAVVIGVDKAGTLPKLKGAAAGALQMEAWLRGEGFEVVPKVDTTAPVKRDDIYEAIADIVDRGADQLVIYFAGHGFNRGFSEFWLLSGAPRNPNEAVSVIESTMLAKLSGIANVVFISDACRSRADSLGAERVNGGYIFPNPSRNPPQPSKVDVFLATLAGDPSFEVPVAQSAPQYQGIYTAAFLDAFRHPDDTMILELENLRVVPNRRMEGYLVREVRKRAEAISSQVQQIPDTQVVSPDTTYIGRVQGNAPLVHISQADQPLTIQDLASRNLAAVGVRGSPRFPMPLDAAAVVSSSMGYETAAAAIQRPASFPDLARTGGLAVSGTQLKAAQAHPSVRVEFVPAASPNTDPFRLIRVNPGNAPAASVALQFDDGGGTVIAALKGFVANVSVNRGQVINVSYIPAIDSPHFSEYASERPRLEQLHSVVATIARFGVFRIEGDSPETRNGAAERLAGQIRVLKGIDPTLGVYAAYAYSEADQPNQIRSVRDIMRGDLGVELFDVDMLSGALTGKNLAENTVLFPFCPMLWQGWNLLRVLDVRLAPEVLAAREFLRPSLWTTFNADGIARLLQALREGRLR